MEEIFDDAISFDIELNSPLQYRHYLFKQVYNNIPEDELGLNNSISSIDLNQSVEDVITMETIYIKSFFNENPSNIIIKFNNNIYLSNKKNIEFQDYL
jgi:hypothetical protein